MSSARAKAKRRALKPKSAAKAAAEKKLELLFEVGCEEIPAGMLARATEDLKSGLEKQLAVESISEGTTVEAFSTPRRLVLWARGLPERQADVTTEVTGPPKSVAFDAVGAPTRAAVSFAEKQGVALHEVYFLPDSQGRIPRRQAGQARPLDGVHSGRRAAAHTARSLLAEDHDLDRACGRQVHPPDPLGGALLDGKPLKFSYGGIAASDLTCGHRFLGSSAIRVRSFADYEKSLKANGRHRSPGRAPGEDRTRIGRRREKRATTGFTRMRSWSSW
jgi:glycyl-tRNA synthetase beta chain